MKSGSPPAVDPLISVIVPIYNHAHFIVECLDSIRDEDWPRLELVLLDDGSRDDSLARAQAWVTQNRSRFERVWLETQANQGICKTLNRLIAAARGDFLVLTASDDTLIRGGMRGRLEHLQAHPDHLAVFGQVEVMGDDSRTISRIAKTHRQYARAWRRPQLLTRNLLLNWGLAGPILMSRRETFDPQCGVGPYDETFAYEDLDMYLRFLARKALGFVDQPVGKYRVHASNFCRDKNRPPPRDESYRVWAKYVDQFTGGNRWVVRFQTWKSERARQSGPSARSWLGRQAISLWRKGHRVNVAIRSFLDR
jgi:glycosyltransferase involved in cell wall biosynthesis